MHFLSGQMKPKQTTFVPLDQYLSSPLGQRSIMPLPGCIFMQLTTCLLLGSASTPLQYTAPNNENDTMKYPMNPLEIYISALRPGRWDTAGLGANSMMTVSNTMNWETHHLERRQTKAFFFEASHAI